ncbi:ABC-2 type transporter-domain-containing protein [Plectosphaerella plurivora]|uniref:ABC-2 type transporter-domain-containing protein n=1 Tax=Plectosphaerella plurivora TaxID=936078 RepID=A0A9P8VNS1_9PEZI|nr:ABC-2 type transporter-domain-containing protein [Plectosphaerella plurivora]
MTTNAPPSHAEKPPPVLAHDDSSRHSLNTLAAKEDDNVIHDQAEERIHDNMANLARRLTARSHASGVPTPLAPRTSSVAFQNLSVYGFGADTDFQKTVGNIFLDITRVAKRLLGKAQKRVDILHSLEGVVYSGETLCVLGPPGSGCSTFLRTIAGETHGFHLEKSAQLNYQGIRPDQMTSAFRGEAIYTAEVDHHFPQLSVGDALYFAAAARCPKTIPDGIQRHEYISHLRDVTMAMFGMSHTRQTRVGNDFVRGVSGGERKRVTIAEASLSYAPIQCWDNSTRGLDSANAIEFCRTIRTQADVFGCVSCVAIYQAPQDAYDLFDKVLVLYDGRQIFFGKTSRARQYFEELGFICPDQQTTADFLTSMTSPSERIVRPGAKVPRTADDFARAWQESADRAALKTEIDDYMEKFPFNSEHYGNFLESRRQDQSSIQRAKSPFTFLTLRRSLVMLKNDPSLPLTMLTVNLIQSLVRKIVEKHARYAFYHPSAEALSSMVVDLPYKLINCIITNVLTYFMGNLRREPGAFFFFLLIIFTTTMTMSMGFRLIASCSKSMPEAMAPASVILLALVLYSGFVISIDNMRDWISWARWGNPVYYGLEALMANEFHGVDFSIYANVSAVSRACASIGSVPGQDFVSGTTYIETAYRYNPDVRWRNWGVMIAFMYVASERSKGEVLVFIRKAMKKLKREQAVDAESGGAPTSTHEIRDDSSDTVAGIDRQTSVFHWHDVCYDVQIKGETRRILDHVDGWVKPGTLTALMGSSGAGKTTLLDVLASRVTTGVVTGDMLVNGTLRDESFQRKTGYVQQQDLHLDTSTVREALTFSALLRQPDRYTRREKIEYVDTVINMLGMEDYADAVIGVPGEGLNVEQRKRLTIGSICNLMEKLTKNHQAILCTIHQPSAMLFQRFDRLLLLSKGRTIYFGNIGQNADTLVNYFTRNGAHVLPIGSNPAEYMLDVIGAAPGATTDIDWPAVWRTSPEFQQVEQELARLAAHAGLPDFQGDGMQHKEFAASTIQQHREVIKRVFQQYWRSPAYIFAKITMSVGTSLFIGLSFLNGNSTQQGLLNQVFGVFILLSLFSNLVNQIMPAFAAQRLMFEVRERPSKTYSWKAFMAANMLVELTWNSLMALLAFFCWYYPIGLFRNAEWTDSVNSRGITMLMQIWILFMYTTTFAHMLIAGVETADIAGGIGNLLMVMMYTFCGVLAGPDVLPRFWIFMYRVNPFTYIIEGLLGTGLGNAPMYCADNEFIRFTAPEGSNCAEYAQSFISEAGGYILDPDSTTCEYCPVTETNQFLASVSVDFNHRWRNFGILFAFCVFNMCVALLAYWLARVPRAKKMA